LASAGSLGTHPGGRTWKAQVASEHYSRAKLAQAGLMPHLGNRSECEVINPSALEILSSRDAVLEVRIYFPPGESHVRT